MIEGINKKEMGLLWTIKFIQLVFFSIIISTRAHMKVSLQFQYSNSREMKFLTSYNIIIFYEDPNSFVGTTDTVSR